MTFRGAVEAFPLDTILELLAATEKTGKLEVRGEIEERWPHGSAYWQASAFGERASETQRGFLGFSRGRLVSAQFEDEDGELALGAVFAIARSDFEFLPQDALERDDLSGELHDLIDLAHEQRERFFQLREVIPTERACFRLSDRASQGGEVTLGPQQWKALLLIDGRRDVLALAEGLSMPRLSAQDLLAGLVRAGIADVVPPSAEAAAEEPARGFRRLPPMEPLLPTSAGETVVLRGRLPDFPLETIVQLLAETKKTGRLKVRAPAGGSVLGMERGRLVSARSGEEEGEIGLGVAFTAQEGEFDFVPMDRAPGVADLAGDLDPLLDRAAEIRDRIVGIRAVIPDERSRFALSERATHNPEILLTPEQWRVLLGVNGERDVSGVADHLRMRRLPTMMVLADLVRGGYVDVLPAVEQAWPHVERRKAPWPEPVVVTPVAPEPAVEPVEPEPVAAEPLAAEPVVGAETGLAETPLDRAPATDDRLAALSGLFGPAEPAPPPAWAPPPPQVTSAEAAAAEATAEAFAAPAPETAPRPAVIDPRLAAFGAPTAPPEAPSWEAPPTEPAVPVWETAWEPHAPAEAEPEVIDPRLAAFGAPPATAAPQWEAPAPADTWETLTPDAPPVEAEPAPPLPEPAFEAPVVSAPEAVAPPPPAPAPEPDKQRGLFGGLFTVKVKPAPAPASPAPRTSTRPGQLANFANELVAAYNSGQYGKARVEDRMLSLIIRADEQADPVDRPLPVTNDQLDVGSIDRGAVPERQALPYLAVLVRQIYDDAERAFGKDKARRGFRDVRDRLFGKDLTLIRAPEVGGRMPKV